jgi:uncharacterized protein
MVGDAELVAASLDGSSVAFAVLVTRHRARVRRVAGALLGDPHEAEDVTQEALLQAYVGLPALRERERFGAWLAAIASNLARMRLRRRGRQPVPVAVPEEHAPATADDRSPLEAVRAALAVLPPSEREAVLACDVLGLSRDEAATHLGCSAGAVRVRLHRARARLRAELREHAPLTVHTKEEREMVEVEVREVVVRLVANGSGRQPPPVDAAHPVVLLSEKGGDRVLPIWIGPPEAGALVFQLAGEQLPRPASADLMARLVEAFGGRVERVVVSSLRENTFFASIAVESAAGREEVDARPSDALNLARRLEAPIYVDEAVLAQAAVPEAELEERLGREETRVLDAPRGGTWGPVSPQMVRGWFEPMLRAGEPKP